MDKEKYKKELIEEIEKKRKVLNKMILKDLNSEEILKLSKDLDILIDKYYNLANKKNKQPLK